MHILTFNLTCKPPPIYWKETIPKVKTNGIMKANWLQKISCMQKCIFSVTEAMINLLNSKIMSLSQPSSSAWKLRRSDSICIFNYWLLPRSRQFGSHDIHIQMEIIWQVGEIRAYERATRMYYFDRMTLTESSLRIGMWYKWTIWWLTCYQCW